MVPLEMAGDRPRPLSLNELFRNSGAAEHSRAQPAQHWIRTALAKDTTGKTHMRGQENDPGVGSYRQLRMVKTNWHLQHSTDTSPGNTVDRPRRFGTHGECGVRSPPLCICSTANSTCHIYHRNRAQRNTYLARPRPAQELQVVDASAPHLQPSHSVKEQRATWTMASSGSRTQFIASHRRRPFRAEQLPQAPCAAIPCVLGFVFNNLS